MYGLGDLKFGHLTFIVLTGILLHDLYPDPDVVCQFLNGDQLHRVTWFYEWILKSLEGVEVHETDARAALMRSQMICSLKYRDKGSKLSKIPPPWIILWSRMVYSNPRLFRVDILSWILGSIVLELSLRDVRQSGDRSKIVSWSGQD